MAMGGGTFTAQNKTLPGTYLNFVSAARGDAALSERGIAAMPLILPWGPAGSVFTLTAEEFYQNSLQIFACGPFDNEMLPLREIFQNARTAHLMRINQNGSNAYCSLATAAYPGKAGNALCITVEEDPDNSGKLTVTTYLKNTAVDRQSNIGDAEDLKDNPFVSFNPMMPLQNGDVLSLSGGTDGTVTDEDYAHFLQKIESYDFNTLGAATQKESVKKMFADFTRRARESSGMKFQCVLFRYTSADYEGVISVENCPDTGSLSGSGSGNEQTQNPLSEEEPALVYWVTGAQAGCRPGTSLLNAGYNGELSVSCDYTAAQLEKLLHSGSFVFHRTGSAIRVLEDINTLTSFSAEKNSDFSDNQIIRLLDQIASDLAAIFNERYIGKTQNDASGRIALWSDIVAHHRQLELLGAIEQFSPEDVKVEPGNSKKSVTVRDCITPTGSMARLYMTVVIA